MIPCLLLAAVTIAAAPSAQPTQAAVLPSVERALALPYPASGTAQPQIILTRKDASVPQMIDLAQATAVALMRVPSLAAARAEVDAQNAAVLLARTGGAPNLSVSAAPSASFQQAGSTASTTAGSTSASGTAAGSAGGASPTYSLSDTATLSLSQLIYDGGQLRAKIDAASLTRDASLATYRRDAQQVAYAVAQAYYGVLSDERTVAVDDELLRQDIISENLVRAQIRAGTEAGADLASQVSTTQNARSTLVSAQGLLQNDRVAFATALGLDADTDVLPIDDTQGLETNTPAGPLPSYAAELGVAYAERPDLEEAQLTVRAGQASLRAAQRGLSPTVSLSASKGLASTSIGGGSFRNNGTAGLSIDIPVYDQGLTKANIASYRATVAQGQANSATTRLQVQQDVREALISIVSDRATLDQTRAAYASSVVALRSARGQYRVGVSTLPALIQAQTTLASAAVNIVDAIYKLRLAQSNLRYALGTSLQQ